MDDLLLENGTDRLMQEDGTSTILLEFNAAGPSFDPTLYSMQMSMMGVGQL